MLYILPVFVFLLDLITKHLALTYLHPHEPFVLTSFFNLYLTFNPGISFSMLQADSTYGVWLLIVIASLICGFIVYAFRKEQDKISRFALMCILGGALGNMWDRLRYGVVVDFLDFHCYNYHWPAFNIADSAICIGVTILIIRMFRSKK